jgi:hypothetical protein
MNSNKLPPQPFDKKVNLKILYKFDDNNTFLARSSNPIQAKIITLPNQPPHNGTQVGCVELKKCLELLYSISPEWFQKGMDYSIYYKDIIESDEPYVATGLCSKIIKEKKSNLLITGRLCTNVINLYQSNSSIDTLDIKLKLSSINNLILNSNKRKFDMFTMYNENSNTHNNLNITNNNNSSSSPLINDLIPQQQLNQTIKKRAKKSAINKIIIDQNSNNNNNNKNNIPQLASRTQSLPFINEDSLAHKIRISDMITSKLDEEIDLSGEPISSRFSNFQKNSKQYIDSQPTKAKKSKSFIQSVVKIGDNEVSKTKDRKINSNSKSCVNCMSNSNPPYKFYKHGIFESGNSGYLCSTCTFHQSKNDQKSLRERGILGSNGFLEGPYSKISSLNVIASSSSSSTLPSHQFKRIKKRQNQFSPSLLMDNSSSPLFPPSSSSPMNLQNGFSSSKFKKQQNLYSFPNITVPKFGPITELLHEDLNDLFKLESTFANYKMPVSKSTTGNNNNDLSSNNNTDANNDANNDNNNNNNNSNNNMNLGPIEDMFGISDDNKFRIPESSSSSNSSVKDKSKNNTPNENNLYNNDNEYYRDLDNLPVDATKLNTTLIPIDDDDKENFPPSMNVINMNNNNNNNDNNNVKNNKINIVNTNMPPPNFGINGISPSIRRIIESFANEPSSPTKTTGNDEWNYNFFNERSSHGDNDDDDDDDNNNDGLGIGNEHTECDDPEINRILAQANDKYEITPKDPGTAQTQQNDSPTGFKMTPVNTAIIDLNMSLVYNNKNGNTNSKIQTDDNELEVEIENKNDNNININNKIIDYNLLKTEMNTIKKQKLSMPSSPFFNVHDDDLEKDDKTLDTSNSLMNWDAKSSPVTDPLSSSGVKL